MTGRGLAQRTPFVRHLIIVRALKMEQEASVPAVRDLTSSPRIVQQIGNASALSSGFGAARLFCQSFRIAFDAVAGYGFESVLY